MEVEGLQEAERRREIFGDLLAYVFKVPEPLVRYGQTEPQGVRAVAENLDPAGAA